MEIVVIRAGANRKLHSKSIAYYMIYSNMDIIFSPCGLPAPAPLAASPDPPCHCV